MNNHQELLGAVEEALSICRASFGPGKVYPRLIIHRNIEGKHKPTDAECWCRPLVLDRGSGWLALSPDQIMNRFGVDP